jgi:hypothetical protein
MLSRNYQNVLATVAILWMTSSCDHTISAFSLLGGSFGSSTPHCQHQESTTICSRGARPSFWNSQRSSNTGTTRLFDGAESVENDDGTSEVRFVHVNHVFVFWAQHNIESQTRRNSIFFSRFIDACYSTTVPVYILNVKPFRSSLHPYFNNKYYNIL